YLPSVPIALLRDGGQSEAFPLLPPPSGWAAVRPALLGSLTMRDEWERAHPRRRVTQVLVGASPLDEDWTCGTRPSDIEKVLSGPDKPKTYVVTVNDPDPDYERLALAGRTEFVTNIPLRPPRPPFNTPPISQFADLIRYIREAEGRCEYLAPSGAVDYDKVNLTAKSGGALFPRVADSAGCARNPQGWYYDPPLPETPTRMIACEGACKTLHGQSGREKATTFVQLGCPTVDAGP
ncbi:MAG TPA: hypothetical protein VK550_14105, partial [Polyangiaceae bacterium]|nr:hypothetical protein [Polyangiaceae bacterium]